MVETFIRREDLNKWVAKYFDRDLISIDELLSVIEDLDDENESLKDQINNLEEDIRENYRPISHLEILVYSFLLCLLLDC